MADRHARPESELHALPGDRERARDDGLRGDDRRDRRENDERNDAPFRDEPEKQVVRLPRVREEKRALPEVIQEKGGVDEAEPGAPDRRSAEVSKIRIENFSSRHREEHGTHHLETRHTVAEEKADRVSRVKGAENSREADYRNEPDDADDEKPQRENRAEYHADFFRSPFLVGEEGHRGRRARSGRCSRRCPAL